MGSSPQRPRILLPRKLVSFSGCSAATHMRNSSSNLTGMTSSVWQEERDNVLELLRQNKEKMTVYKAGSISSVISFFLATLNVLYKVVCIYQVKHQRLFVVSSHVWKVAFDLGFYIALVSSKEADSSYSLHQITDMPCLHSQLCYFAKHTESLS